MAIKICPNCSNRISDESKICPYCGKISNKKSNFKWLIETFISFLTLVTLIITALFVILYWKETKDIAKEMNNQSKISQSILNEINYQSKVNLHILKLTGKPVIDFKIVCEKAVIKKDNGFITGDICRIYIVNKGVGPAINVGVSMTLHKEEFVKCIDCEYRNFPALSIGEEEIYCEYFRPKLKKLRKHTFRGNQFDIKVLYRDYKKIYYMREFTGNISKISYVKENELKMGVVIPEFQLEADQHFKKK